MEWLSVSQVSEKLDIPAETIRRYINRHDMHLQVKKVNKSYYLVDTCMDVLVMIRNLYGEGKQVDEVTAYLDRNGIPMNVMDPGERVHNDQAIASLESKLNVIASMLMNIDERLKANESFKESVAVEFDQVREKLEFVKDEVVATTSSISDQMVKIEEKVSNNQQELEQKLDQVLSRIETYGKKKSWWKMW